MIRSIKPMQFKTFGTFCQASYQISPLLASFTAGSIIGSLVIRSIKNELDIIKRDIREIKSKYCV